MIIQPNCTASVPIDKSNSNGLRLSTSIESLIMIAANGTCASKCKGQNQPKIGRNRPESVKIDQKSIENRTQRFKITASKLENPANKILQSYHFEYKMSCF